jgi:hypothetical protein
LGAHDEILQAENVAYSRPSKIFVNDLDEERSQNFDVLEGKKVDRLGSE